MPPKASPSSLNSLVAYAHIAGGEGGDVGETQLVEMWS